MGEVYRVRDTRLDRDVAIKALPEGFARAAECLARFEREAKLLASLNHTNIVTIYGLEELGAERIDRGAIPLDEVIPLLPETRLDRYR